jgi:hypothetical protein
MPEIPNPDSRKEMLAWARSEFERHRHETDPQKIKYLVAMGTKEAQSMSKMTGQY